MRPSLMRVKGQYGLRQAAGRVEFGRPKVRDEGEKGSLTQRADEDLQGRSVRLALRSASAEGSGDDALGGSPIQGREAVA